MDIVLKYYFSLHYFTCIWYYIIKIYCKMVMPYHFLSYNTYSSVRVAPNPAQAGHSSHTAVIQQPVRRLLQPLKWLTGPPVNSFPCDILSFWLSSIWVRVNDFFQNVTYFNNEKLIWSLSYVYDMKFYLLVFNFCLLRSSQIVFFKLLQGLKFYNTVMIRPCCPCDRSWSRNNNKLRKIFLYHLSFSNRICVVKLIFVLHIKRTM